MCARSRTSSFWKNSNWLTVDGLSWDPPVLMEAWAHIGAPKSAQKAKVMLDAQLVEPAAADARLAAQLDDRRLVPLGPVEERLSQACQTVSWGHRPSSAVDCQTNSVRVSSGPLSMSAVSGFTVGCKA